MSKTNQDYLDDLISAEPQHLIVDASLLAARMAYAMELSPVFLKGEEVDMNGVAGFIDELLYVSSLLPTVQQIHICWEGGGRSMRRNIFPDYKAQRDKPSSSNEYMVRRVYPAKEMLRHRVLPLTPYHQLECRRWEGDDAMGTLSKLYADRGMNSVILSNDHDMYQLLSKRVHILQSKKNKWVAMSEERLLAESGLRADQVVDQKALAGDASDNYKGVPRVGDKTASKMLFEHGGLEDIVSTAKTDGKLLGKPSWAKLVCENVEAVFVGRALATIRTDAELRLISKGAKDSAAFNTQMAHLKLHHLIGVFDK